MSKFSVGPPLYDKQEAAAYVTKGSIRHLERLIAAKKIGYRKVGRRIFFTQGDLDQFIEDSYVEAEK